MHNDAGRKAYIYFYQTNCMRKSIFLFLLACIAISSYLQAQKTIAIICGHLLDTQTGEMRSNQVIIIKGNLVQNVLPAAGFQQKTDSVIDLSAYYVLPGLTDCHTHVLLQGDITSEDYDVQLLK